MSIVEQSVDCLKNEERIKDISTSHSGDVIKVLAKEMTVEMDVDTVKVDKTEQQTNGSASKLKEKKAEESNEKKESETKSTSVDADVNSESEPAVEKMDVDAPANGNGVKEDTNGDVADAATSENSKETDETEVDSSGEGKKTGSEVVSDENKNDESNAKIDDAKVDEKTESDETMVDESKVETNANVVDTKKPETSADTEEPVADVEMSEKECTEEKTKTETEQSNIETVEKKNNNESSENVDAIVETNEGTPKKQTSEQVEKNSVADVEKIQENVDIQPETNGNDIKESDEIDKSSATKIEETTDSTKIDVGTAKIDIEGAKELTKSVKDEEMKEVNDENEPPEPKVCNETAVSESENNESAVKTDAKEDEQVNKDKVKEDVVEKASESKVNESDIIKDKPELNAKGNSSPASEQISDKKSKDEIKEDPPNSKDDEMGEPTDGKSDSVKLPTTEEGDDQEMSEPPAETESKTKEDIQAIEDEPANQTIYVDENRYFESGNMVELSRIAWKSQSDKQQYVRGCLWSPDGTCILAAVNMDGMHVINLGTDLYTAESVSSDRPLNKLESVINVKEGGTVYDYCWYPFMNSTLPETCCWISSRQHCPIQLWDGFNGDLRGSYRGYDNVDEIEAAFSVAFTSDAEKIIGGYKKTLKIFDTKSPGREYSVIPIKQPCSCLAVQETQSNIIATGSWNCAVNLYDLRAPKLGTLVTLEEHTGGVTFLKFAASGDSLFSGARKDNKLFEWDMRNFSKPIRQLNRTVNTNQRIYFDLSPGEKWLASGDTDGLIHVWDLKSEKETEELAFELHRDCCNGVSFHPSRPMLATCSGQYHFLENIDMSGTNARNEMYENSLIFWWVGRISESDDDKGAAAVVDKPEPMAADENDDDGGSVPETGEKMES